MKEENGVTPKEKFCDLNLTKLGAPLRLFPGYRDDPAPYGQDGTKGRGRPGRTGNECRRATSLEKKVARKFRGGTGGGWSPVRGVAGNRKSAWMLAVTKVGDG